MDKKIIELFQQSDGQFLSGENLSRQLGCSRTAVWKHIQKLREQGYEFEAVSRRGYRITYSPDRLNEAVLADLIKTKRMGRTIRLLKEVDSTQIIAQQLVEEGVSEGTLVIAEQQSAGRGRLGRAWHSPPGKGIWMSLVLYPSVPLPFISQLTLLASVAVCRAIRKIVNVDVGIKWPNDLLINKKKVCGILLESAIEGEQLRYVVAGIGVSVNLAVEDYPDHLREKATSLRIESGHTIDRHKLIAEILSQLEELYELHGQQGFAPIRLLWEALNVSLHQSVRVQTSDGWMTGVAEGIDDLGALKVRLPSGEAKKVYSGDVELR